MDSATKMSQQSCGYTDKGRIAPVLDQVGFTAKSVKQDGDAGLHLFSTGGGSDPNCCSLQKERLVRPVRWRSHGVVSWKLLLNIQARLQVSGRLPIKSDAFRASTHSAITLYSDFCTSNKDGAAQNSVPSIQ